MAEAIAAQILEGLGRSPGADMQHRCVEHQQRWVMGSASRPYLIRVGAHRDGCGRVVARVRVDTPWLDWTWCAPVTRTLVVDAGPLT